MAEGRSRLAATTEPRGKVKEWIFQRRILQRCSRDSTSRFRARSKRRRRTTTKSARSRGRWRGRTSIPGWGARPTSANGSAIACCSESKRTATRWSIASSRTRCDWTRRHRRRHVRAVYADDRAARLGHQGVPEHFDLRDAEGGSDEYAGDGRQNHRARADRLRRLELLFDGASGRPDGGWGGGHGRVEYQHSWRPLLLLVYR